MKEMNKKDQDVLLLGPSAFIAIILSTMDKSGGSTLQNLFMGVVTGIALVGCCIALWNFGKRRKNQL